MTTKYSVIHEVSPGLAALGPRVESNVTPSPTQEHVVTQKVTVIAATNTSATMKQEQEVEPEHTASLGRDRWGGIVSPIQLH
ncbi:hypothetical protein [uncultured Legionella sp.]|uniref:hypothetical protein n=1 Tax=uncultured Legionella sp. TaxID=210934 RepID=UPI002622A3B0|nr:hypothetical protein [uncultured Legionella sp.]